MGTAPPGAAWWLRTVPSSRRRSNMACSALAQVGSCTCSCTPGHSPDTKVQAVTEKQRGAQWGLSKEGEGDLALVFAWCSQVLVGGGEGGLRKILPGWGSGAAWQGSGHYEELGRAQGAAWTCHRKYWLQKSFCTVTYPCRTALCIAGGEDSISGGEDSIAGGDLSPHVAPYDMVRRRMLSCLEELQSCPRYVLVLLMEFSTG